jgi:hypothetical protein
MSSPEQILSEFMDEWNAGRRPRVRDYIRRAATDSEREELAEQITTWLEVAPTPAYSEQTRATIRDEPAVQQVFATVGEDESAWPIMLPRMRERAGLGVRDLAARLVDRLQLGGPPETDRAAEYLSQMERGELRADRVSKRLLDALGRQLGMSGDALAGLGGGGLRPSMAGGTLFRANDAGEWVAQDIEVLSMAAMASAPPPMDELDRLFCGGPDA